MTITVKDESQLKGLLDDEEYDAFVKDLEEKNLKEDNKKGGLGGLFSGKGDADVKSTGQDETVAATAVGETSHTKDGDKAHSKTDGVPTDKTDKSVKTSNQDETNATKTGN